MAITDMKRLFRLDADTVYLNHAAYGACPTAVLEMQASLREQMERNPTRFFSRELEGLLDTAREALAAFLHAPAEDVAFVPNPTYGINTVLRALDFGPGDELLTTDHAYVACRNALEYVAQKSGAKVVYAQVPFPLSSADAVEAAVLKAVTPRTRLALLDHVTSPTALVFPIERLVAALEARGVPTLVDGAHAPGQVPMNLKVLNPAYYVGHGNKWLCGPKGGAFLYARADRQQGLVPLAVAEGHSSARTDRSRFRLEFDWGGTIDPSPFLCLPEAIRFLSTLFSGGIDGLLQHNHALALRARTRVCEVLNVPAPCPDEMVGAFFSVPLPDAPRSVATPLREVLALKHRIEVAMPVWPAHRRMLRLAAQAYNRWEDFERLAEVLPLALREERGS